MALPTITHATCRVELTAIQQELADGTAQIIRSFAPNPIDCPPGWITEELVATALVQTLAVWWQQGQHLEEFPDEHTPVWTLAYFS